MVFVAPFLDFIACIVNCQQTSDLHVLHASLSSLLSHVGPMIALVQPVHDIQPAHDKCAGISQRVLLLVLFMYLLSLATGHGVVDVSSMHARGIRNPAFGEGQNGTLGRLSCARVPRCGHAHAYFCSSDEQALAMHLQQRISAEASCALFGRTVSVELLW